MPGRRFTEEERKTILEGWFDPKNRKEICQKLQRTEGTCAFEYYRMLRKRGISPAEYKKSLLDQSVIQGVQENSKADNKDFLVLQLENLITLIKQKEPVNIQVLLQENLVLKSKVASLETKLNEVQSTLKSEREAYQKTYNELDYWLNQYFNLTSIEKLASLKDFLPRVKTVVDKYGTVVGLVKEGDLHPMLKVSTS